MFMSVIIVLLIASVSVASLFLFAFIWSVKSGQFDDAGSPAVRILFDDHPGAIKKETDTELVTIIPPPKKIKDKPQTDL